MAVGPERHTKKRSGRALKRKPPVSRGQTRCQVSGAEQVRVRGRWGRNSGPGAQTRKVAVEEKRRANLNVL